MYAAYASKKKKKKILLIVSIECKLWINAACPIQNSCGAKDKKEL